MKNTQKFVIQEKNGNRIVYSNENELKVKEVYEKMLNKEDFEIKEMKYIKEKEEK